MANTGIGTCTNCGKKKCLITAVDEETMLCEDCLEDLDYIHCDECDEYWLWDAVCFLHLTDGRCLCENCAEDADVGADEVESIDNFTGSDTPDWFPEIG